MKNKIIKGLTVISAIATLLFAFGDTIFVWILKQVLQKDIPVGNAASIGIIGGADGPTAVYLAGTASPGMKQIGAGISFMLFIMGLIQLRKARMALKK